MPDEYQGEERRKNDTVYVDIAVLKEAQKNTDVALVKIDESFHDLKADIRTGNKEILDELKGFNKRVSALERWRSGLAGAYAMACIAIGAWWKTHGR